MYVTRYAWEMGGYIIPGIYQGMVHRYIHLLKKSYFEIEGGDNAQLANPNPVPGYRMKWREIWS